MIQSLNKRKGYIIMFNTIKTNMPHEITQELTFERHIFSTKKQIFLFQSHQALSEFIDQLPHLNRIEKLMLMNPLP